MAPSRWQQLRVCVQCGDSYHAPIVRRSIELPKQCRKTVFECKLCDEFIATFSEIEGHIDSSHRCCSASCEKDIKGNSKKKAAIVAGAVLGGVGLVAAAPFAIAAAGFGAGGIVAGSAAAAVQSAVYGGATGGLFSTLTSIGAAGMGATSTAFAAGAGAAAGAGVGAGVGAAVGDDRTAKGSKGSRSGDDDANFPWQQLRVCAQCGDSYHVHMVTRSMKLGNHVRSTGFECKLCNSLFEKFNDIERHIDTCHSCCPNCCNKDNKGDGVCGNGKRDGGNDDQGIFIPSCLQNVD